MVYSPSSAGLSVQYNLLLRDIANTTPSNGEDQFRCTLASDGDYSVGLMRSRIKNKSITNASEPRISWGKTVPLKVSTFIWRANMGRIPSAIELNRRGLKLGFTYCSSYISGDEGCDHQVSLRNYGEEFDFSMVQHHQPSDGNSRRLDTIRSELEG